jgi:signal transduction histidine kinase
VASLLTALGRWRKTSGSRRRRCIDVKRPRTEDLRQLDDLRLEVEDLRASRERLALAHEAERRVFERALHDGVQQLLVGLAANLELATADADTDPGATIALLGAMRQDVQQALEETRTLAHRLYPPLLEAGGLRPALRAAAASAGVRITTDIPSEATCPPGIAGAIYFSCVDALEQAGAGSSATITVRNEEGAVSFVVLVDRDLGTAWVPLSRDRVEALGGRLNVGSEPDERTQLVGSLPLSR